MAHFVRRLVEQGYRVAMVARFEAVMKCLAAELPQTRTYRYHIGQPAQVKARFAMIVSDWAGRRAHLQCRQGVWGIAGEVSLEAFQTWRHPRDADLAAEVGLVP